MIHDDATSNDKIKHDYIQDLLVIMVPWLRLIRIEGLKITKIQLDNVDSMGNLLTSEFQALLNNLLYLSITFGDNFLTEIESLWIQTFYSDSDHDHSHCFEFMIKNFHQLIVQTKSLIIVETLQKISICLSRSKCSVQYFHTLCKYISPKTPSTNSEKIAFQKETTVKNIYIADLLSCIREVDKKIYLGICHSAIILVSAFILEISLEDSEPYLPLLIHAAICHSDHSVFIIHNQSRHLLLQIASVLYSDAKKWKFTSYVII